MRKVLVIALTLVLMASTLGICSVTTEADAKLIVTSTSVSIEINSGVQSICVSIGGTDYDPDNATVYTSSTTISVLANAKLYWVATAKSGYIMDEASGSITAASGLLCMISPTATKGSTASKTLNVIVGYGVKSITVTYGSESKTFTSSSSFYVVVGETVSWTAVASPGYTLTESSGSFTMSDVTTIYPSVTVKSFTVSVTSYTPTDADATFSWSLAWASGKSLTGDPSDYVTMTVASDTKSVTLTFKKDFSAGEIILTCSAGSAKATCTVKCSS